MTILKKNTMNNIIEGFVRYFQARGKDELKSFLTTLVAGFTASFIIFAAQMGFSETLFSPEVIEWAMFAKDVLDAFVRSVVAGILFALMGDSFPIRSSKS